MNQSLWAYCPCATAAPARGPSTVQVNCPTWDPPPLVDSIHYRAHRPNFPQICSCPSFIFDIAPSNYPLSTLHSQWSNSMFVLPQLGLKILKWHNSLKNDFLTLKILPCLVHIQVHLLTKNHSKILKITTSSKLPKTSKSHFDF